MMIEADEVGRSAPAHAERTAPPLTGEQLGEVLALLAQSDTAELKLSVPDEHRRSAVAALDLDPLAAQLRQVVFFDTPDLRLNRHGVVVRARRVQQKAGDTVVKLRPVRPEELPPALRSTPGFGVEVDAMPGGFVCSASMKGTVEDRKVKDVMAGRSSVKKLLTKPQREFFARHAPDDVALSDLAVLGPVNVLKLKVTPAAFGRRIVAELWLYPDGARILELSTKCAPAEAFTVAAETKAFLTRVGIDIVAEQHTKTKSALEFFAREAAASAAAP